MQNGKHTLRLNIKRNGHRRPLEEVLMEYGRQIPPSVWRHLPRDLSYNLDHYLYGYPKRKA